MEPQHFGHEHPLSFNENVRQKNYDNLCNMCEKQVSGPNYSCEQCSGLLLHKTCAELPRELQHPLHPKHSLLLINAPWNPEAQCEGCNRGHIRRGFNYYCFDCNFNLDRKCASLPLTVEVESHAHPLTLMRRSVSFTCDACGKQGKGMFYSCAVCPFLVHLECTSFPLMVKLTRHTHPLNLTNPLHKSDHQLCLLCVKNVNTDYMVYYCSTCDFIAHLHCAINEELWDTGLDESIDSFPYVVLKSQLRDDKIEKAIEIKHFSHEHDLKLTAIDGQLENNEICDACTWPIYSSFSSCAQCRFFLHKSCVELPRKMSHPLHRHPLILLPEPPYVGKHFSCDACKRICNGFTYNCGKCMFNLDVQCSLMPDIFNHDSHEHQLILSSASSFDKCSSCDFEGKIFRCANCEYTLDFKYATLPRTTRYGPFEQPFTLYYKDEDDSSGEYYCDICEEERNPKHWFYYCADLSFPAHPHCILGRFPCIKSGRTYTFDMHEHPLTLVDKSKGVHLPCDRCGSPCDDFTFKCINCDFNLHRWCFPNCNALAV